MPPGPKPKPPKGFDWKLGQVQPGPTLPSYTYPKQSILTSVRTGSKGDLNSDLAWKTQPFGGGRAAALRNSRAPQLPTSLNPHLGQGSRAWALAHGSEMGLIPNPAGSGLPGPIDPGAPVRMGNNPNGSGGGNTLFPGDIPIEQGFVPKVADLSQNPYGPAYDKLLAYVQQSAAFRPSEYAAAGEQFKMQQEMANKQMYDAYMNSRQGADASAVALGVDPAAVSATRDLAMRKSQENSDQSLADNLAWLQKSGLLAEQGVQATGNMYAHEQAAGVAKWNAAELSRVNDLNTSDLQALVDAKVATSSSSGSGGGGKKKGKGGKGGSGGGSSKASETASESDTMNFGGMDLAAYNELAATDPAAAAAYKNLFNTTLGNAGVAAAQTRLNTATVDSSKSNIKLKPIIPKVTGWNVTKNIFNNMTNAPNKAYNVVANASNAKTHQALLDKAIYQKVLDAMLSTSGIMGNTKKTITVKSTAKKKLT